MTRRTPPLRRRIHYTSVSRGRRVLVEQVRFAVLMIVTGCFLLAWETTAPGRVSLPIPGWSPSTPSLGLLFTMAVGFLCGEREGGITGLLVGWLADATGGGGMMLLPLLYFLCGYAAGRVGQRRLAHNLPSFVVFSVAGGGLECLFSIGKAAMVGGALPPLVWVWRGLVPVWVLTVLSSPIVYGLVWGEMRLLKPK